MCLITEILQWGMTALINAVHHGRVDCARVLLNAVTDINAADNVRDLSANSSAALL